MLGEIYPILHSFPVFNFFFVYRTPLAEFDDVYLDGKSRNVSVDDSTHTTVNAIAI